MANRRSSNDGTSETDLRELIEINNISGFVGFFSWDRLHDLPLTDSNWCAILNFDKHDGPGTHWVGVYQKNAQIVYFDSFGLPPPRRLKTHFGKNIIFVDSPQQAFHESNCGERVVNFFFECFKNDNLKNFAARGDYDPPDDNIDFRARLKKLLNEEWA